MFFLSELALQLIFITVFLISYFVVERFFSWNRIASLKIPYQAKDFMGGFFMGLIALFVQVINESIYSRYSIQLFTITVILLAIFKNYIFGLYSIIPGAVYWLISNDIDNNNYIIMGTVFAILIAHQIARAFAPKQWVAPATLISAFGLSIIGLFISAYVFSTKMSWSNFEIAIVPSIFLILSYFIVYWFLKFSISSNLLFESANFVFSRYYRAGLASNAIGNFISSKKVRKGVLGIFDIKFDEQAFDTQENIEIVLESISEKFPQEVILFDSVEKKYGFFIPFTKVDVAKSIEGNLKDKREKDDVAKLISDIFAKVPRKILIADNVETKFDISIGMSYYGVQSSSITELISNAVFAKNTWKTKNDICVFNPQDYKRRVKDNVELIMMDKAIQLDDISHVYENIIDVKTEEEFGVYSHIKNLNDYAYTETIDEIVYTKGWQNTVNRYIASETVQRVGNQTKLFFDYSLTIFEDEFDIDNFKFILDKNKISPKNIYMVIKKISADNIKRMEKVSKVAIELSELGINFVFEGSIKEKFIEHLKIKHYQTFISFVEKNDFESLWKQPDYVFDFDDTKYASTIEQLKNKYISGYQIISQNSYSKATKKSKIYLSSILKGE